jgi:hypothetical protein
MRPQLWQFDTVCIDLEDRDVKVKIVHAKSSACVTVEFRMPEAAIDTTVQELKRRAEFIARERLLELASYLDEP